jgi:hypothetical protein
MIPFISRSKVKPTNWESPLVLARAQVGHDLDMTEVVGIYSHDALSLDGLEKDAADKLR